MIATPSTGQLWIKCFIMKFFIGRRGHCMLFDTPLIFIIAFQRLGKDSIYWLSGEIFPKNCNFWWTFNNFFDQSYDGMSQPLSCPWGHVPTPAYHNQRDMMELAKTNGLKRFHFTNNLWQETLGCPNSCPTRLLLISASMLNKSLKIDDWKKENLTSIGCHWVDTQLLCACDHKFVVMALAMTHYV